MRSRNKILFSQSATEPDMTPMVDCQFLLLIYFLLIFNVGTASDNRPEAVTAEMKSTDPVILIVAFRERFKDWQYRVGDTRAWVTGQELETTITSELEDVQRRAVVIRSPANCPWFAIQRAADAAKSVDKSVPVEFEVKKVEH